jgi:hypothetical protein
MKIKPRNDPYYQTNTRRMKMKALYTIVVADEGETYGEAVQWAMEIAIKEWRNVILKHHGKRYRINVNDLVASVQEEREDAKCAKS